MQIGNFLAAVVTDLKTNAPFLRDVGTHGKVFGLTELKTLTLLAPACRIALVGSRGGSSLIMRSGSPDSMGRANTGQFRGPLQLIAFLVEQDLEGEEARDRAIRLVDQFVYFFESRTFGLSSEEAGPAMITGFEILYSAEIDAQGAAIAAVTWEQEVWFGRSLHDEDMALLTGDEYGGYPSGQPFWPEKEWADKGDLVTDVPPRGRGRTTGQFVPDQTIDPECPIDSPADTNENYKVIDVESDE